MAHFAELDENNIVLRVIVVNDLELLDNGNESETKGIEFCTSLFGGTWVQTSYNAKIRKNYAAADYFYNETLDAFVPPQPKNAIGFDEETCQWIMPIVDPDGD